MTCDVNVIQSGGPATCFIIAYEERAQEEIKRITGTYFHQLHVNEGNRSRD